MSKKQLAFALIVLSVALFYKFYLGRKEKTPVLELGQGKIQGVISLSRGGKEIYQYLGIPFAKPPIGELRFEDPQPAGKWDGILDASKPPSLCLQIDIVSQQKYGNEDCLYLNVYVPKTTAKKPLSTIVYIHGGLFMYGGTSYFGPKYFADEDVILVNIAYRLASLGFLNTGSIRGNMGLKDQVLALKWIQDNIARFGGDPGKVTLIGESAGACSTHLHMLSPLSKGLFQKAISQSGTAISPFLLTRTPEEQAKRFGRQLNCPTENSEEMIKCLKQMDADTLIDVHQETNDLLHEGISIFSPSIERINDDKAFLTEEPMKLLKEGKIVSKVPWISGVNSNEALIVSAVVAQNETLLSQLDTIWLDVAPKYFFYSRNDKVSSAVRNLYFKKGKKIKKDLEKFQMMLSDRSFNYPISEAAKLQAKVSPVFLYYYAHSAEFSLAHFVTLFRRKWHYVVEIILDGIMADINKHILGRKHHNYGCCHSDQLFLQFDTTISPFVKPSHKENYEMSRDLVKLWADFAKDIPLEFRKVKWTPATTAGNDSKKPLRYLMIDMSYGMIDEPFSTRIQYWKDNYIY